MTLEGILNLYSVCNDKYVKYEEMYRANLHKGGSKKLSEECLECILVTNTRPAACSNFNAPCDKTLLLALLTLSGLRIMSGDYVGEGAPEEMIGIWLRAEEKRDLAWLA
ncbi:unnamed protein product [Gongylonema pulchrum]|uniref:SCP domain-containing protein n=1 Tax=Gongylonema pulchrum TaxID=637853 RepID=A0A183E4J7_9BILA|nr:unnamed protein product [Gongylonema pulchrum]